MPNERISMLKLKQLIALQVSNLSPRGLARALGLSVGARFTIWLRKYLTPVGCCSPLIQSSGGVRGALTDLTRLRS